VIFPDSFQWDLKLNIDDWKTTLTGTDASLIAPWSVIRSYGTIADRTIRIVPTFTSDLSLTKHGLVVFELYGRTATAATEEAYGLEVEKVAFLLLNGLTQKRLAGRTVEALSDVNGPTISFDASSRPMRIVSAQFVVRGQ
jgi:hypothetical protein